MINRRHQVGDKVRMRFGSNIERDRWTMRRTVGEVVEGRSLAARGYCIRVKWPDEALEEAFHNSGQSDPA